MAREMNVWDDKTAAGLEPGSGARTPNRKGKKKDTLGDILAAAAEDLGRAAGDAVGRTVRSLPGVPRLPGGGNGATYVDDDGERRRGTVAEDPYWDAMREYYRQAWQNETDANNARAAEAAAAADRQAETDLGALNARVQGTNRQLYRDYMERRRLLPRQLSAQGYTGGLSESARVRLENSYGEALADNERSRSGAEADIRAEAARQAAQARSAADEANARALREREEHLAELNTEQRQDRQREDRERAELMARAGDFSGYLALGYTPEETEYLAQQWRRQNPKLADTQRNLYNAAPEAPAADSAALAVARYIQRTRGTGEAVDYVAQELAAGRLFSDQAEVIRRLLRGEAKA